MNKKTSFIWLCILQAFAVTTLAQMDSISTTTPLPGHPRLLLLKNEEKQMLKTLKQNATLQSVHESIIEACDSMLNEPPVLHVKVGRRLLDKSRTCLRRVFFLSYAWRLTHEKKYLARAEKEMLAVSAFSDWNPSHFLDVAEMTSAVAIGYDWLHDELSPASRAIIKKAIIEKGLKPSFEPRYTWWLKGTNNWNQVCNAGMVFGSLAVYDDEPQLARTIINRAIKSVELPMKVYAPDGGYPEGYIYWGYGTSYNVLLLDALDKAFGTDFGLSQKEGFMQTAAFIEHMSGSIRLPFNFYDSYNREDFQPAMFWFASKLKKPSLLYIEQKHIQKTQSAEYLNQRLLPAALIWSAGIKLDHLPAPEEKFLVTRGSNPVALMRSAWTDTAIFVGFKGGSPHASHAHMDAGSFVMDADGQRWAMDFGLQDYESLESKGIDLFNMAQNSPRWQIFRYNNYAHNTLTVNNALQNVKGNGQIVSFSAKPDWMNAVVDLTSLYPILSKAHRGVALINNSYVSVKDELMADSTATIRWTMLTPASAKIIDKHTIELTQNGKKLFMLVKQSVDAVLKTWSTKPTHSYDAPNSGTVFVGFETALPAKTKIELEVLLVPEKNMKTVGKGTTVLANWPK